MHVLGKGQATEVFNDGGVVCRAIESMGYRLPLTELTALRLLRSLDPDLFLGGASYYGDPTNARLLTACKKLKVPTVGLLDHWKNLDRFDGPTTTGLHFAPDILGVMDETTKTALEAFGFHADRLCVVGHPYLQQVYGTRRRLLEKSSVAALRRRAGVPADGLLILCCSEMLHVHGISEACGPRCQPLFQVNLGGGMVLDRMRHLARRVEVRTGRPCIIALRPHPFEQNRPAVPTLPPVPVLDTTVCTDIEAVAAADVVVGMSSMPMIQAYVLRKPVISLRAPSIMGRRSRPIYFHWDSDRTFTVVRGFAALGRVMEAVARGRWPQYELTGRTRSMLRNATGRAVRLLQRVVRQACQDQNGRCVGAGVRRRLSE